MSDDTLYDDPMGVRYYDIAFDWRRESEAEFLERCAEVHGNGRKGAVLDLGCGGGQFLAEMQQRGWQAAGVDLSSRMIALAKQRVSPGTPLSVACMSSFSVLGRFDAAPCWLDSLPYLLTNEDIIQHFRRVGAFLKKDKR